MYLNYSYCEKERKLKCWILWQLWLNITKLFQNSGAKSRLKHSWIDRIYTYLTFLREINFSELTMTKLSFLTIFMHFTQLKWVTYVCSFCHSVNLVDKITNYRMQTFKIRPAVYSGINRKIQKCVIFLSISVLPVLVRVISALCHNWNMVQVFWLCLFTKAQKNSPHFEPISSWFHRLNLFRLV